jgi:hypothetical protein
MAARSLLGTLLVVCCVLYTAHAQTGLEAETVTENFMTSAAPPTTTEAPITEFSIELYHRESSTSSISIVWRPRVPDDIRILKYIIETTKKGSKSVITSPVLPANTTEYIVEDLIKDSKWRVCVVASVKNVTDGSTTEHQQCLESFTIPYIRDDSLYVLAIVILVIGGLIVAGYMCWRCAVNRAEKAAQETEEEEDDSDEGKLLKPQHAQPILLSPVDNSPDRPKSSIEEEDIPFITPPWSEIEKEEWERSHKANNVA